ncbi:MAG: MucR family transcriptional regulator [Pseudodonghicola sp.]
MDTQDKGTAGPDSAPTDRIAAAVSQIVAAYAARPDAGADDIVALTIRLMQVLGGTPATHPGAQPAAHPRPQLSALASLPSPRRAETGSPVPALPIDQAVTDDKVYCLCCGRGFTMLKRHLKAEHGLTEEDYRALFGLPADMPLVAPNYSERKAAYAKRVGLGKYQRDLPDTGD